MKRRSEVCISGMSCQACEVKIERAFRALPGVAKVDVNAATGRAHIAHGEDAPSLADLNAAVEHLGYRVQEKTDPPSMVEGRPSIWQVGGLVALVLFLGFLFGKLGWLNLAGSVSNAASFGSVFLVGLLAASSSCIAVSGGLMLSGVTSFAARHPTATRARLLQPILLFVTGRLAGYALFGGLIGLIGQAIAPPPLVTGLITAAVAVFMLVMGLDMLGIAPSWLKRILPRMPKALAHRVLDAEGNQHPAMPLLLGAGTFFLPCGFTQSLQLYALTTGSFLGGATALFAFALGTAPALIALGWASSALKGRAGKFFLRFSGALVAVLGIWNVQNGLAVAGFALPEFRPAAPAVRASNGVRLVDGRQVVDIEVTRNGYYPNNFTLQKDVPATLRIAGEVNGCLSTFVVPKFGVQKVLDPKDITEIALMPSKEGKFTFACGMGMFRGQFTVTGS
ncbi:hypothetical protein EPO33_01310 [Patescibacteria group bacterium]|nr:MAG: hypothetical protein EPO33_01310 [Patescibacteria group bacterium]